MAKIGRNRKKITQRCVRICNRKKVKMGRCNWDIKGYGKREFQSPLSLSLLPPVKLSFKFSLAKRISNNNDYDDDDDDNLYSIDERHIESYKYHQI